MPIPTTPYPVALVEFEGQPVPPDAVRSLTLETNVQYLADALELVLDNAQLYSDFLRKEQPLEVWLGYVQHPTSWHKDELVHVFSGAVDGVLPAWGADMTLTVRARDHTRLLIDEQGDPVWAWEGLTDAALVALLAHRAGLAADISLAAGQLSETEWTSLPGGDAFTAPGVAPSAWDIVQRLAVRNGYVAYVGVDKRLYFGPRGGGIGKLPLVGGLLAAAAQQGSLGTWTYFEAPHDVLAVEFDDSALVVNKVTVARWLGLDGGGYVSGSAVDAGRLAAARGRVIERTVVGTTAADVPSLEAEAAARLAELARAAITATATVEGDPRLAGDARITLAGTALGRFRGDYYVLAATHRFGTDGYTTVLQLSSERPEASEVYRPALAGEVLTPEQLEAGVPGGTGTVPTCGDAPIDYAAEWPEFGGPLERLLEANGLPAAAAHATCGPIAAAGMLKAYGIRTDPGKLARYAYDHHQWTGGGMAGPDSEVALLVSQGLQARNLGRDIAEAIKRASACQPVIFDTAGTGGAGNVGHYILASAYRASDGRFFGGVTISNAMLASHHNPWATVAEIESYDLGAIRSVIVADVPLPMKAGANQAVDPTGLPSFQSTGGGDQRRMVDNLKPLAYAWEKQTGIPAVVLLAINASESNWGNTVGNSIFGMGAHGNHTSQVMASPGGRHAEIPGTQRLATYPDANAAYADFVDVVTHGRYANAYATLKQDPSGGQFVAGLQSAGYAEDVDWPSKIARFRRDVQALL